VLSGQVALEHHLGERRELVALCGPGDWFGELGLLTGGPRTADACVTLDATLVRVSRAAWTALSLKAPQVFVHLCERLSRQLRATTEPPPRARRSVIACVADGDDRVSWLGDLERSLRRQFPARAIHVLGRGVHGTEPDALDRALAAIVERDAVVLLTGIESFTLADRRLQRKTPTEWLLAPSSGAAPIAVRGTSAQAAIDRAARHVAAGTIGIALGAGGAYGFAHVGMLRVLEDEGIPIDCISGTSMGAIVGGAYASGIPARRLAAFAESVASRYRSIVLRDLDLRGSALLRGEGLMSVLGELDEMADATFETLSLPFAAIAMDLHTGERVVIDAGPVLDGIRPSFAMPGILPPCPWGDHLLVDGAMVDPVPVETAHALGANFVIAAQPVPPLQGEPANPVSGFLGHIRRVADHIPFLRLGNGIENLDVTVRSFQSLWFHLASWSSLAADGLVRPDLRQFWFLQFGAAAEIILAGARAAEAAMPDLRRTLSERIGFETAPK
jgi:NTE family protein